MERLSYHSKRRRNIILVKLFVVVACIVTFLYLGSIVIVNASNRVERDSLNRYYTSITIEPDDTLWDIADMYNTGDESRSEYIKTIKQLNNMNSDILFSGENILVYYYSSELK